MSKPRHFSSSLLAAIALCCQGLAAGDGLEVHGGRIQTNTGQNQFGLAVVAPDIFRVSFSDAGRPAPAPSCFLAGEPQDGFRDFQTVRTNGVVGFRIAAGALLADARDGSWRLENSDGKILACSRGFTVAGPAQAIKTTLRQPEIFAGAYGSGNGTNSLLQFGAQAQVGNGRAVAPFFWSPAGYAALAVTADDNRPAGWSRTPDGHGAEWVFPGRSADLYLMPAVTLADAAKALARLTGRAPVPPRWAFGYLQSRWGWKDKQYIGDVLQQFRQRAIPVGAFIFDFEWYAGQPDYALPPEGVAGFKDFGWNTNLFPQPAAQIKEYRDAGVRFVAIRKPRLGNQDTLVMAHQNHWIRESQDAHAEKFQSRDLDFSNPGLRAWYAGQTTNLLQTGVDGWWNDEGEGTYTTYYYWNLAEAAALAKVRPDGRLWTLNRAFSPGLQRLGAAAWTGDIRSTWQALAETPASLLNWSLAGMPYCGCDIGGYDGDGDPSPELLVRWMQAGVFFPVMRSHSAYSRTPRFPWLYGVAAEKAIRQAIGLRSRLLPYYYSLAHQTHETGLPLMRPLIMEFPHDKAAENLTDEWMAGESLLAAPVLNPGGQRQVYLPAGAWYALGTGTAIQGPQKFGRKTALDEIPVYVKAGSILPLRPPADPAGECLELQIYPGKNTSFTLVEDDGETTAYLQGDQRTVRFQWDEAAGTLAWHTAGPYEKGAWPRPVQAVLFDATGPVRKDLPMARAGELKLR